MFSVIVPIYNASKYLQECLDSILSQDFTDFELLLIDDGSTDNSGKICDEYAEGDARVKVFHQKNQGVSVARNVGLDHARGEWIIFVDADDWMLAGALTVLYKASIKQNVDIVMASAKVMDENGIRPLYSYTSVTSSDVLNMLGHSALWGYMFKTSIISEHHIRFVSGLAYSEDRLFCLNMAMHCKKISVTSDDVYVYRRNETSACASKDGVRKASHQFHAASEVHKLILQTTNSRTKVFLKKKEKQLLNMGYMTFVKNSSWRDYAEYETEYMKYFDGRFGLLLNTLKAIVTHIRRSLLPFNDNPLTGRIGLKRKVQLHFNKENK